MSHTPGPWNLGINYVPYEYDYFWCHTENNKNICSIPGTKDEIQEANARLIAAAPDLLEACKSALHSFKKYETEFPNHPLFGELEQAIKKAKGEL